METLKNLRWSEMVIATRNLLTVLGGLAVGAWFAMQVDWLVISVSALLVAGLWWCFYRLSVAVNARHRFHRTGYPARYRAPGKRAQASWAHFVEDVRAEKSARAAGW